MSGTENKTEFSELHTVTTFCEGESMERCYRDYGWKYVLLTINVVSVAINIFHLIVLRRIPSLRGTAYLFILYQISVADMYSTIPVVKMLCSVHQLYLNKDLHIAALYASISDHCGLIKYNVLAVASFERYLSICCPFTDRTIERLGITLDRKQIIKMTSAVLWLCGLGLVFLKNFLFKTDLCVYSLRGPDNTNTARSGYLVLAFIAALTFLIAGLNLRVLIELRNLAKRNQNQDSGSAKRATYYIIVISIAYYVCLLPSCVAFVLHSFGISLISVRWIIHIFYSFYGIFNVVIYGWIMKPYRQLVWGIFRCCCKNRVGVGSSVDCGETTVGLATYGRETSQHGVGPYPSRTSIETSESGFVVAYNQPVKLIPRDLTSVEEREVALMDLNNAYVPQ